jgi:hypothetical protein
MVYRIICLKADKNNQTPGVSCLSASLRYGVFSYFKNKFFCWFNHKGTKAQSYLVVWTQSWRVHAKTRRREGFYELAT